MSLISTQKLPNKTQNSGPKSVSCRHTIENSQWSLLGVHYVFLKKKDEEEYDLMEFKNTSYQQDVPGKIILLLVLEGILRSCHSLFVVLVTFIYIYVSSFSFL